MKREHVGVDQHAVSRRIWTLQYSELDEHIERIHNTVVSSLLRKLGK